MRDKSLLWLILPLALGVALVACAPEANPAAEDGGDADPIDIDPETAPSEEDTMPTPSTTPEPASEAEPTQQPAASGDVDADARTDANPTVAQAITDLAERLGVPESAIEVVSYEAVTWADGSLGCPQPGMAYTQALVEGHQIILMAEGQTYDYRAGDGDTLKLCTDSPSTETTPNRLPAEDAEPFPPPIYPDNSVDQ